MMPRFFLLIILCLFFSSKAIADDQFSQNNPDRFKYEFARSYVTALSYMKDIDDRWNKNAPKKLFANDKLKMIVASINDLTLDSSDLLIIKHYLLKYLTAPNMLMRKVADMVVVSTSREVEINHEEKSLWEKWYDLNHAGEATKPKSDEFVKSQYALELRRKDCDKDIIQATILMTKVLVSDQNKTDKGHLLAITAQQRQNLLNKLDSFGGDDLDWGLKPHQRTLESCISVIREVLEDPVWISLDEKS